VADLHRIRARALRRALDVQHVHHAFSAADIALWDVLGKRLDEPVWRLLDGPAARPRPKRPYASSLFGDTPEETRARAARSRALGFDAAKFGWGPLGRDGAAADQALVAAARDGLGPDGLLLVDGGWAWGTDVETALARAASFAELGVGWLEEPLLPDAIDAYGTLAAREPAVPIAAGESSGRLRDAEDFVANARVQVLQIDAGRIGGITPAHAARRLAERAGISYVNHTFKSHLSLAAGLHAFATVERFELLEYAVGGSALAEQLVADPLTHAPDGTVALPDRPGLGVTIDEQVIRRFLRPVSITVGGAELAARLQVV
jgi:L-alanine-DL-glutamate epimerase-like enolase superfamily enzyme